MAISWLYHRKNCTTCQKAQDYLQSHRIATPPYIDARKVAISRDESLAMAHKLDRIVATKGTKVVEFNLKESTASDDELVNVLLGPGGKLRAPALIAERTLLVGFNEDAYRRVFAKP